MLRVVSLRISREVIQRARADSVPTGQNIVIDGGTLVSG